jgi:hypothetical protein
MRWRGDSQHASVSAFKDVCAFAHDGKVGQHAATIREKLFALSGQDEEPPNVIK